VGGALLATGLISSWSEASETTGSKTGVDFTTFLRELWPSAEAKGVSRNTFDAVFGGLEPDPRVIELTGRQPEYSASAGQYINVAASTRRTDTGMREALHWGTVLNDVEREFAVDRWTLLAIWGIETNYGTAPLRWDVIRSLATLADAGYRHPYFRNELIIALELLQADRLQRQEMFGSWAGAMGQPQFMPSSFLDHAIDFSGDGQTDIWNNVPDVLGSMANYLRHKGWSRGVAWGYEVIIPEDFEYSKSRGTFSNWTSLGLKRANGETLPAEGSATLLFPSGASNPAFLVTENFLVLKRYNNSDLYALAVGQLADRMKGLGAFRGVWVEDEPPLSRSQRIALQHKLDKLGYPVDDFHGHIDFDLRDSIRTVQMQFGMTSDGYPTLQLLQKLGILTP
jgi:membrane-bound lytic murein transglycosylase B